MKYHQLRIFLAMAEHGSIRAAARALSLTQPAVTKTIRALESEIGLPLVQRNVNGVALTEHGQALLARAQIVSNEMQRTETEMSARRDGAGGSVRIAVSTTASLMLLPHSLSCFTQRLPLAKLSLYEASTKNTLEGLSSGSLDFAVIQSPAGLFPSHLQSLCLFEVGQQIVVRRGHPGSAATSLTDLSEYPWVVPLDTGSGEQFSGPFPWPAQAAMPSRIVQCSSLAIACSIIRETDFVSVFSEPVTERDFVPQGIVPIRLGEQLPPLTMSIVFNAESVMTSAADCLMACFRDAAAAHIASSRRG